ncbi:hypothetical protein M409DRAFT_66493 [Zasmidium cellare ATCC 36951]|uniref:Major facilitator superfamily (MFS) profile domain-containing protein n=1 Tax=Zasmidium cellare ATCC 36951 TaxID=1080233 RepID=A0A6A6CGX3_ZASCE|nr:uncharacterized protein M409DRAFT_66493 [Zasmidium cellare ATCC 36951]KAF2166405.1 hypothetical protein M409DRAFT_66493 [Zasmidium cellare ATCC 36951]
MAEEKAKHESQTLSPRGGPPGMGFPKVEYPTGFKLYSTIFALYLAGFLTALDRTIMVNAIPTITAKFDSIQDIGWYGSAYLFTFCCFQLLFGKIYTFYNAKWVFMIAVVIFLVGSAICGAASSSIVLIVGRAIAGLGSSGIFGGSVIITFFTVPLHMRPIYSGIVGVVFAVASIVGPLIGGALTQHASWRWCFFINLPVGAVTLAITFVTLKLPPAKKAGTKPLDQVKQMDPLGNLCLMPAVICLLLALEWGGSKYSWSNGRIVALLVIAVVLGLAFIGIQIWLQDNATVPPRLFKQRSMAASFVYTLGVTGSMMTLTYYLPVWFQAIKAASPTRSGVMMLPMVVPSGVAGLLSGFAISKLVGYYTPFMLACAALMSIGAGLLTTFEPSTGESAWIGYQFIWGFGAGLGIQSGGLVAQTVLSRMDAPAGISLNFFAQSLSGSVFIAIDQTTFMNSLHSNLDPIPGINVDDLDATGASVRSQVSEGDLPRVLGAYNDAVTNTFVVATACACLAFVAACVVEWRDVRKDKDQVSGGPGGKPSGVVGGKPGA